MKDILLIIDKDDTEERNDILKIIIEKYEHRNIKKVYLDTIEINECVGCFECSSKNLGQCEMVDKYSQINFKEYKEIILLSRIVYGMPSSKVKSVLDRRIVELKSFLKFKNLKWISESRIKYENKVITIGYGKKLSKEEKNNFINIINFRKGKFRGSIEKTIAIDRADNLIKEIEGVLN